MAPAFADGDAVFSASASFVLPDSVNDNVQWLLYALAAGVACMQAFVKRAAHYLT